MNKVIKYNLEILTCILVTFFIYGRLKWNDLTYFQQITAVYMVLYVLHEWEESRFPGGFYRIFFSKCTIDPNVSEAKMHFPVAVYLLVILVLPFVFGNVAVLALIPLVLALFEGFIHTAGIFIHDLKKPYSPGMITAWMMFLYSVFAIVKLNQTATLSGLIWIAGIFLTAVSFVLMETQFLKTVGITIKEFQSSMKNHMLQKLRKTQ